MKLWAMFAVLGLLVMGTWAQGVMPTVDLPPCDSPEAEAAGSAWSSRQVSLGVGLSGNHMSHLRSYTTEPMPGQTETSNKSAEDMCLGCPQLIPLNDTDGLQLIESSLNDFNKNQTLNSKFALFEIGRMASQVLPGGIKYFAEYAIIDTNCTSYDDDSCIPQNHTVAIHGFCLAEGFADFNQVDCNIFPDTVNKSSCSSAY
ncbi:hypothetical protein E1301_Tti011360 [Triplophysa tibetana]|uniref:Cystatin domain-containing protein n=1 Tax=Triplophysa tibetana TaxID=1572043 RepID=A0A5A9PCF4_9TELE|nr:hypothetical protein E1301_Tti011360 [Triplophysa tibetana]